jgi:hypothetical protein
MQSNKLTHRKHELKEILLIVRRFHWPLLIRGYGTINFAAIDIVMFAMQRSLLIVVSKCQRSGIGMRPQREPECYNNS